MCICVNVYIYKCVCNMLYTCVYVYVTEYIIIHYINLLYAEHNYNICIYIYIYPLWPPFYQDSERDSGRAGTLDAVRRHAEQLRRCFARKTPRKIKIRYRAVAGVRAVHLRIHTATGRADH